MQKGGAAPALAMRWLKGRRRRTIRPAPLPFSILSPALRVGGEEVGPRPDNPAHCHVCFT